VGANGSINGVAGGRGQGALRVGRRVRWGGFYRRYEAVTTSRDSFDETRLCGGVSERRPNLQNGDVETSVKIDEGVGRPKFRAKLVTCNQVARPLQQHRQEPKWLLLKANSDTLLPYFAFLKIHLKRSKPHVGS
jgi:hypothetical protein